MLHFRTLLSIIHLARCFSFFFFLSQFPLKHNPNTTYILALLNSNRVKTCPQQGAPAGSSRAPPAGPPYQPGGRRGRGYAAAGFGLPKPPGHGSGPVHWHMTQPVHTVHIVLARATRASPRN